MAVDLAFDFFRHDLVLSPNQDIEIVSGQATVDQRIRARLFIEQGEWILDPTDGQLGSHIKDAFRMSLEQALQTIPMLVKECLAPMPDIEVDEILCAINEDDPSAIDLTVLYRMIDQDSDLLSINVTVTG